MGSTASTPPAWTAPSNATCTPYEPGGKNAPCGVLVSDGPNQFRPDHWIVAVRLPGVIVYVAACCGGQQPTSQTQYCSFWPPADVPWMKYPVNDSASSLKVPQLPHPWDAATWIGGTRPSVTTSYVNSAGSPTR